MWKRSKFFKDAYIVIGKWSFDTALGFPHCKILAGDTETKLYYKNKLLTENEAYHLYNDVDKLGRRRHTQTWIKKNVEVRAYAFMLSDGESFALFQNAEDFLTCVAMMNADLVLWYNAKFDFAIFDYYFLTNGYTSIVDIIEEDAKRYRRMPDKTYQSLNGPFGQRYSLRVWKKYINRRSQEKVHNFTMIDVCNIFGGGLRKNLEDWKIKDHEGKDVRKLDMDYVEADVEADIDYMVNDTKGLYLLAEKIDKTMFDITGYSLFKCGYMTAGGLAKKTLLKFMYGHDDRDNKMLFKMSFPITVEADKDFRNKNLYMGGKCLVNPDKQGKVQRRIYKYDVNSMYPDKMRNMLYPFGEPKVLKKLPRLSERHGKCYILAISNMYGFVRPGKIGVWQDAYTGDYSESIREAEQRYMWIEELQELENWYRLDYDIDFVLEYAGRVPRGVIKYVDTFYDIKKKEKGAVKQGAKLLLNSAYGKLAQRIEREVCEYQLDEETGAVHLVKLRTETDEASMMNVVVGSRVTALARVHLLKYMREICKEDVHKNFIYCDTDSVHALTAYDNCDDNELGMMKCEGIYEYGLYLAPKSYLLYDGKEYEVHCKGVNTNVVKREIERCKSFEEATEIFKPNRTFKCLCGLNVRGGKALIYVDKMIVNDENYERVKKDLGDLEEVD